MQRFEIIFHAIKLQICTYNAEINECNTNRGGCDEDCINTPGSYYCQCGAGFTLNSNGRDCDSMFLIVHDVC